MSSVTNTPHPFGALMEQVMTDQESVGYHSVDNRYVIYNPGRYAQELGLTTQLEKFIFKMHELMLAHLHNPLKINAYAAVCLEANIEKINSQVQELNKEILMLDFKPSSHRGYPQISINIQLTLTENDAGISPLLELLSKQGKLIDNLFIRNIFLKVINKCNVSLLGPNIKIELSKYIVSQSSSRNWFETFKPQESFKEVTHFLADNPDQLRNIGDNFRYFVNCSLINVTDTDLDSLDRLTAWQIRHDVLTEETKKCLISMVTKEHFESIYNLTRNRKHQFKPVLDALAILPSDLTTIISDYSLPTTEFFLMIIGLKIKNYIQNPSFDTLTFLNSLSVVNPKFVDAIIQTMLANARLNKTFLLALSANPQSWVSQPQFANQYIAALPYTGDSQEKTAIAKIRSVLNENERSG